MRRPQTALPSEALHDSGSKLNYRRLVYGLYALFVSLGILGAMRPSPYDFLFILVCPMWLLGGVKIPRGAIFIIFLWIFFEVISFAELMPYLTDKVYTQFDDNPPALYQFRSFYIISTVVFFTLFFAERTIERAEITLKAYTLGALAAAFLGILDNRGIGLMWSRDEGRASATFDDPNLYGSYLTLAGVYLLQRLLLGKTKHPLLTALSLLLIIIGIFVSFSRGSWGAFIFSSLLMGISTFVTTRDMGLRRRMARMTVTTLGLAVFTFSLLLAQPDIREMFTERAKVTKEYDEGVTGRFGNQMRSIPLLFGDPAGFGPDRWRNTFGYEPHNSYVGAFANDGWAGGIVWFIIVGSTIFVGFRQCFARSPYQQLAQVFGPVLFAWLMQGFQIDIDHWRQLFLAFGAVWGIEAARLRWQSMRRPVAPVAADEEKLWQAGPMR